jgi:hypothetical protein
MDIYKFETYDISEYRNYRLPPQFWEAYLLLRNWVLRNQLFVDAVYLPWNRDTEIARAWGVMDRFFDMIYESEVEAGRL